MSHDANPLPRQIGPGLYWLGDCLEYPRPDGILHANHAVYLIAGTACSMLVEGGFPHDLPVLEAQMEGLLAAGAPPVKYLFLTHQETPHAAGLAWFLDRFASARVCGDMHDYHLIFPDYVDRFLPMKIGDRLELGETQFVAMRAIIRDLHTTLWGFDTRSRALFPGDGFAYVHFHNARQCGHVAEEIPDLPLPEMTALFAELALHWTRYTDMTPYINDLVECVERELRPSVIGPTHGQPITDIARTFPKIVEGLQLGSVSRG